MGYGSILFTLSIMLKTCDLISNVSYCAQINSVRIEDFTNVRVAGKGWECKAIIFLSCMYLLAIVFLFVSTFSDGLCQYA